MWLVCSGLQCWMGIESHACIDECTPPCSFQLPCATKQTTLHVHSMATIFALPATLPWAHTCKQAAGHLCCMPTAGA